MPDDTPATPATTTVTEDNAYDISKFTKAPFVASYGNTILGGTEGPISINPEFEYEDISCNQAGGQAIVRILKSIKYRISEFLQLRFPGRRWQTSPQPDF